MSERIDYKLLQALAAVVKEQSFERAALSLFITQSAVSQRIKQLEQFVSQPVIVRSTPLQATDVGKKLISHYYQVEQLERELSKEIFPDKPEQPFTVHLATNADSLATWLIPAVSDVIQANFVELNFVIVDEKYSLDKLRGGEVFGAISEEKAAIKGCQSTFLGNFSYVLVASPSFKERYFSNGITAEALTKAPAVTFGHMDTMHTTLLSEQFGLIRGQYPLHTVGSSEAFVMLAKSGTAYCLVSELQIKQELASGELVNILPNYKLVKPLYWQSWVMLKGVHKALSDAIIKQGHQQLMH
ncbi:LysR family transcriptional regulator ArgP [Thalassotalea ganghwensis]